MFACEFLKGWPQTHWVRRTHSPTADTHKFSLAMARRRKPYESDRRPSVKT